MNKQQFGYKLGKLYLKFNSFIQQKAEQYKLPTPFVYVLMYTLIVMVSLFSLMLFAIIMAILVGLMFLSCLVNQEKDESSDYDDESTKEEVEHIVYGYEDRTLNNEYEIYYD
ncbi:hypothetical protein [Pasteurella multocida]|uniref:hypothetical protein n=1 Tax=Pasteurella multocida TaxID=747 RepID=UPI00397C6C42